MQNWLTYYQTKYERDPTKRPKTKVLFFILKFSDLVMLLSVSKVISYPSLNATFYVMYRQVFGAFGVKLWMLLIIMHLRLIS